MLLSVETTAQDQPGSIRGVVHDRDFDVPLAAAQVVIVETGQQVVTSDQGHFVFDQVQPGTYTVLFAKDGYDRQVTAGVVVTAGRLTDVDASLAGEFTEMDEFIVHDVLLAAGTEAALLEIRFTSPSFKDSISSDLMSRAGASDAAVAISLVTGVSVEEGKFAVVRGLPDRYVSSQLNGVRLPSADEDKRAVELDQFPAAVIESIQVSKTFTPDQQGDASGGAVDVRLKSIPDETIVQFTSQISYNTQVTGRSDFLTYRGGGVSFWGTDDGDRDVQVVGQNWEGAVGVSEDDAPIDYKWSLGAGGKHTLDNGVKVGGLANFFYERDSSFFDDGVLDSYWVVSGALVPETVQGAPDGTGRGDFKTALFDVTQGSQLVQWGTLATLGLETEDHRLGLTYLATWTTEDVATLAEDTRGKEFFFPGYDVDDLTHPGNQPGALTAAPFIRSETLEYTERTTGSLQLNGVHTLPLREFDLVDGLKFRKPELDWILAKSYADLNQPDKRQFGSLLQPSFNDPGAPPFTPPSVAGPQQLPFKPAANFTLGNLQRTFKEIEEDSDQYALNLRWPFEEWRGYEGYVKAGLFDDHVERRFDQDTFSNFGDTNLMFPGGFDQFWSAAFPFEQHPITDGPPFVDVDYDGEQDITAWYSMMEYPLLSNLSVVGGARLETTEISVINFPEDDATFAGVDLNPGDADVDFEQNDLLPSIGLVYTPVQAVTLRASYSETVARQTFKELTPITQQEFQGAPIFIGNPELQMSGLDNYDLRLDYTPYQGGLLSVSWFTKDIEGPIEYRQDVSSLIGVFTTAVNYPNGTMSGYEFEVRQSLDRLWDPLKGLALGANATFIDGKVDLPPGEIATFQNLGVFVTERDMTNAPEHLYNLYLTYDLEDIATQMALFYTVKGDTLVTGAGASATGLFVPSIYAKEYGTLNFSISRKIGKHWKLVIQAKNLTDPEIEEVYRHNFPGGDVTRSSYTKGMEFSVGFGVTL